MERQFQGAGKSSSNLDRGRGNASVCPTDLLISCARPRAPRSDAARPLPRLTMHSEEAICNGRDAVAQEQNRSFSSGPSNGRVTAALGS